MNKDELAWVRALDPKGEDGTIQSIFMGDISPDNFDFLEVLKHLTKTLKTEKEALVADNIRLSKEVNNLLTGLQEMKEE